MNDEELRVIAGTIRDALASSSNTAERIRWFIHYAAWRAKMDLAIDDLINDVGEAESAADMAFNFLDAIANNELEYYVPPDRT